MSDQVDMGDIWIRWYNNGEKFTGDRVRDQDILARLLNKRYFRAEEFDHVLVVVSEYGFNLAYEIKEEADV